MLGYPSINSNQMSNPQQPMIIIHQFKDEKCTVWYVTLTSAQRIHNEESLNIIDAEALAKRASFTYRAQVFVLDNEENKEDEEE